MLRPWKAGLLQSLVTKVWGEGGEGHTPVEVVDSASCAARVCAARCKATLRKIYTIFIDTRGTTLDLRTKLGDSPLLLLLLAGRCNKQDHPSIRIDV